MSAKFKSVALSAVMMASLLAAGAASAQIVVGGGATLPEILYDDILPSGVGKFDYSYTGTGSGAGKTAFFNNSATAFDNESLSPAPTPAVPLPNPWGASQSVHFAGSDSALTSTELGNYNSAHLSGWGRLIQIPTVATSVLLPYKRSGTTALNLTTAQVCGIFGYKAGFRTWGNILGNGDTTPIAVVYRTDTSGTSELLSRFLSGACGSGSGFVVSNSFATAVGGAVTAAGGTFPPAGWQGFTGSSGVSGAMTTDGRLGYLSPETGYTGSDNSVVAKINGNLPDAAGIRTVLGAQTIGSTPANPLTWVPTYAVPATGYPIFGTTNVLVNQCYKDAGVKTKIVAFLTKLYGTPGTPGTGPDAATTAKIVAHNFVTLPDGTGGTGGTQNWIGSIKNTFLDSNNPLGIGNTNVCNGIGRPLQN